MIKPDYIILVSNAVDDLENQVKAKMVEGYQPTGNLVIDVEGYQLAQPVVRISPPVMTSYADEETLTHGVDSALLRFNNQHLEAMDKVNPYPESITKYNGDKK